MASIKKKLKKDGSTSYQATVRLKGFPPKWATFEKRIQASSWAVQVEADMRAGRYSEDVLAKKYTVAEMIDRYCAMVLDNKLEETRHIRIQRRQLAWWKKAIGSHTLFTITPVVMATQRDQLGISGKRKRKAATVNRYLSTLNHVFNTAIDEWGWLEKNPITKVKKPKEPSGRVRFLSAKELVALLAACKIEKRKPLYLIVVLAISTGARKMELLSLDWKDVDLPRKCIILQKTKNGERRQLFLSGLALEQLTAYEAAQKKATGLLFPSRNKKPIRIEREWHRTTAKAGITDFRFHDLRHTAASYLAMNGASIAAIAEVLGHKKLEMVKRYAHLCQTHTASVVASMNAKVFGVLEAQA